ncbi:MAG: energy-coupling factor transporter ATPase [Bacillota bacterium]|jgi:energy-coupling factor transport system ATP-binding protein|nr:energy-coupling factor transporter ATPase [Bacillota bacterium]HPZ54457.1 energy-coupling factor transporter ATPase [Bacillota bacterium]HQD17793.1 energy-coupling factor transporter ATPase [Bacillota bacterium]
MGALISVENVVFEYVGSQGQQVRALDSVSLEVGQGEFVAIIGHNGSGKSTLAKHLNGLLVPVSGRVIVGGKCTSNPDDIWSIRQTVGMVFQNPDNQLVATTVEDDVAFGPENLGVPPDEIAERVRAALSAVGLEGLELRSPGRLSGGQKQRVAIAGVLSMKPECIVLDEPTAMLDPIGRREVLDTVRRLSQQEGKAVVLVTHFMEEAAVADRVVVMANGRIEMAGPPQEVFARADRLRELDLDVPVAAFIASELRKRGVDVPYSVLTVDELANYVNSKVPSMH